MDNALAIISRSDAGKLRPINEDAVYVSPRLGLAILADGMGGYNAGEVASGMATSLLGAALEKRWQGGAPADAQAVRDAIAECIVASNEAIHAAAQSHSQYAGMGTTLVLAMFCGGWVTVAHVGDSRLYRLRGRQLTLLTRDHSLLQEQLDRGLISREEAGRAQHKNLVTRAVGIDLEVEADIASLDAQTGDLYLLCSDGLNDMLSDEEIAKLLLAHRRDLPAAADALVRAANDAGGRDNVSLILAQTGTAAVPVGGWLRRLLDCFGWRRKRCGN